MVQGVKTQTFPAVFPHFFRKGNPVLFNLLPELLYLFSSVAVAVHTTVAQICIGLKAELLCLRRTVFYQLIIQFIQMVCNPLIKRIHLCSRLFPDFPILMV